MMIIDTVVSFLQQWAPPVLAEDWDNVGLLVGDPGGRLERLMTCLTITPATVAEAVQGRAELIVSHHPFPFHPLRRVTTQTVSGRMLWELAAARVAVYCPHTALDSAPRGINQQLARGLKLRGVTPLLSAAQGFGAGRMGWLEAPVTLGQLARRVREFLHLGGLSMVGDPEQSVRTVAVACGAAGSLLEQAIEHGCDAMLVGEMRFHACLEAEAAGLGLILPGHYASERFALERLATLLAEKFPGLEVWASRQERDPIRWLG
jgi:dinuclear metal center YbgI/SA1388 family protein